MGVLAHNLLEQVLEQTVVEAFLENGQSLLVPKVVEGVFVVVEPARKRLHREGHAVGGPGAKVALAQVELRLCKGGLELVAGDAVLGELAAGVLDELAEAIRHVCVGALE